MRNHVIASLKKNNVGRFTKIDDKLENVAEKLNAKLTKDRPEYPEALRTFEERRIDWREGNIFKAIIIQPNFEEKGVNSTIWNFINIAWYDDGRSFERPQWINILADKTDFRVIEENIDSLLSQSEMGLKEIGIQHLK